MLFQEFQQPGGLPQEDPRVPIEPAGAQEFIGRFAVGFFAEPGHLITTGELGPPLDVPVAFGGIGGLDANQHARVGMKFEQRRPVGHRLPKRLGGTDEVVGRGDQQSGLGVALQHGQRGQTEAGGGIAGTGLEQHLGRGDVWKLMAGLRRMAGPGHHPGLLGGDQRAYPMGRLLDERFVPCEGEELLGTGPAAFGPEPRPATARHNHQVQHVVSEVLERSKPRSRSLGVVGK